MEILFLSVLLFPGFLLGRRSEESAWSFLASRSLLSFFFHGILFGILIDTGHYSRTGVALYLLSVLPIAFYSGGRAIWRGHRLIKREVVDEQLSFSVIAIFVLFSGYWSLFFPPYLLDSLFYHLPIAKISADPALTQFYSESPGRFGWLFQGATGSNIVERTLSLSFLFESEAYRLAPAWITGVTLVACLEIGRTLGLRARGRLLSLILLVATPLLVTLNSDYKVDLYTTAFTTLALVQLTRIYRLDSVRPADIALSALVVAGAAWSKNTGILVLGFPALFAFGSLIESGPTRRLRCYAMVFGLGLLLALPHLLTLGSAPAYPNLGESVTVGAFLKEFVQVGILQTIRVGFQFNGMILVVFFGLALLRLTGFFGRDWSVPELIALALIPLWVAGVALGIYRYQRLDSFGRWGHYLLPLYPTLVALAALYWGWWIARLNRLREQPVMRRVGLLSLAGLLLLSPKFFPDHILIRDAFQKFGAISFVPAAPPAEKYRVAYAEAGQVWKELNRAYAERGSGTVLTEDPRMFYLDAPVLDAFAVPPGAPVAEIVDWLHRSDVAWIVVVKLDPEIAPAYSGFKKIESIYQTQMSDLFASEAVDLYRSYGAWRIYRVNTLAAVEPTSIPTQSIFREDAPHRIERSATSK